MMKLLLIVGMSLFLVGCNEVQPTIYSQSYIVVKIPDALKKCPDVNAILAKKPTEKELADLLAQYRNSHEVCKHSFAAIDAYLAKAQDKVNSKK